ncbi:MAG: hypothetical protein COA79_23815 [Planctomycetota bacterium]|nr:MAG: hypothetical protein COA79_23815 [Planctomycetota bacterium]
MNILFIGNSHTFAHGIPFQARELFNRSSAEKVNVSMVTCGGKSLGWHAGTAGTRLNILCNQWDHIILQQATHPFATREQHEEDFLAMNEIVKGTGAKISFCMTWARKNEPEKQSEIEEVYTELADKLKWRKIPISKIWQKVIKEFPAIELYKSDESHASPAGAYLVANMCYGIISGNTVTGLPGKIKSGNVELVDLPITEIEAIHKIIDLELSLHVIN